MTNAAVEATVAAVKGRVLTMKDKTGEKKIVVPPQAPIVSLGPGDRSLLKPGNHIFIVAAIPRRTARCWRATSPSARTGWCRRCDDRSARSDGRAASAAQPAHDADADQPGADQGERHRLRNRVLASRRSTTDRTSHVAVDEKRVEIVRVAGTRAGRGGEQREQACSERKVQSARVSGCIVK